MEAKSIDRARSRARGGARPFVDEQVAGSEVGKLTIAGFTRREISLAVYDDMVNRCFSIP